MSSENSMGAVEVFDNVTWLPGVDALVMTTSSSDLFEDAKTAETFGKHKIVPWGSDNMMPAHIIDNVGKSEVLSSGMLFNTSVLYGQGVIPKKKVVVGGKVEYHECTDTRVIDFFEDNDIPGFFLEQCTDMAWFHNVFPEIILDKGWNNIVSLRSKEATFSRWGVADTNGMLTKHFYSAKWGDGAQADNTPVTSVLNTYNPYLDLTTLAAKRKGTPRFIIPVTFPSPGKMYYQRAPWWSVFNSGWFDYSTMIPEFKKALLKNGLSLRFIIYVSDKYWDILLNEKGINKNELEKVKAAKAAEVQRFQDFLSSHKQAGKGMVATKRLIPSGSSAIEEKYIEIVALPIDIKGGEYIEDSEEVSNIMSYAMGVHPSLIGSTPGKNKGSFSGTDKRELFMIKSAMMKPYRDRMLRVFNVIKRFNKWDKDTVFVVPEMEFTTLDKNKTGKQENTQPNANQ